jgi:hypothetical protein
MDKALDSAVMGVCFVRDCVLFIDGWDARVDALAGSNSLSYQFVILQHLETYQGEVLVDAYLDRPFGNSHYCGASKAWLMINVFLRRINRRTIGKNLLEYNRGSKEQTYLPSLKQYTPLYN